MYMIMSLNFSYEYVQQDYENKSLVNLIWFLIYV